MACNIKVAVRIRPEKTQSTDDIVVEGNSLRIANTVRGGQVQNFTFDKIIQSSSQEEVFQSDVRELVDQSLDGFNATVFAFGMTGSGKTFTISGSAENQGIVPRCVHHVFSSLRQKADSDKDCVSMVFLTYVELYNNILYDLLNDEIPDGVESTSGGGGLKLHDHPTKGITISGSSTIRTPVSSADETLALIQKGNRLRATASTNLNERSSRSHTVISLEIVSQCLVDRDDESTLIPSSSLSSSSKEFGKEGNMTRIGKINLVDLAGSERVKISGAEGQTLEEAKQINKALTVLGDVLNSLSKYFQEQQQHQLKDPSYVAKMPHVPYRNSKLTMLLKDSLGGNAKTMMIATIRPSSCFYQQTMITLRYAARAKLIRCNPVQNINLEDSADAKSMHKTLDEVARLKNALDQRTKEFEMLRSHLDELESQKNRHTKEGKITSIEDSKHFLAKEEEYRRMIETIQEKASQERLELQERLRCVIHHQEGKLAEKDQLHQTLEMQLEQQMTEIESLSKDRNTAMQNKKRAELTNQELHRKVVARQSEISNLQIENAKLRKQLSIALDKVAELKILTSDRDQFVDALQKLTASRSKYKKKAEDAESLVYSLQNKMLEYTAQNTSLSNQLEEVTSQLKGSENKKDGYINKLHDQEEVMSAAVTRIKSLEAQVCTLKEDNAALNNAIKANDGQKLVIEEHHKIIEELTAAAERNRSQLLQLYQEREDDKQKLADKTLAQQNADKSSELEITKLRVKHMMEQLMDANVTIAQKDIELAAIQERAEQAEILMMRGAVPTGSDKVLQRHHNDTHMNEKSSVNHANLVDKEVQTDQASSLQCSDLTVLSPEGNNSTSISSIPSHSMNHSANHDDTTISPNTENKILRQKIFQLMNHEREMWEKLQGKHNALVTAREKLACMHPSIYVRANGLWHNFEEDDDDMLGMEEEAANTTHYTTKYTSKYQKGDVSAILDPIATINKLEDALEKADFKMSTLEERILEAQRLNKSLQYDLNQKIMQLNLQVTRNKELTELIENQALQKESDLTKAVAIVKQHIVESQDRRTQEIMLPIANDQDCDESLDSYIYSMSTPPRSPQRIMKTPHTDDNDMHTL